MSSTSPTRSPAAGASSSERRGANPVSKRILILHVRAGAGHERAARAVAVAIERLAPGTATSVNDALDFSSRFLRTTYASSYNRVVARAPRVWGVVYKRTAHPYDSWRQRLRTWLAVWGSPGYQAVIDHFRPEAILCTQFLPAEVLARWREKSKLQVPVATVITDFAIHPVWVYRGVDRYFVATESVREELIDTGLVPSERIDVTGVPIDPRFAVPIPKAEARRLLGLDPDPSRLTILLVGGGFGWGPLPGMLEVLLELPTSVQALVIAGKNDRLRARLHEMARGHGPRIQVHGFTDQMDLFMAASDLIVGKSGGLTSSEAMARGVPLLVYRPIPGQEERNCDFLQESGSAVRVHDLDELHYRLHHFLANPEHLERMRERAFAIGRPRSAFDVARKLLDMAG